MSWTRKDASGQNRFHFSGSLKSKIMEVDPEERRISLGIKQCTPNPRAAYVEEHPLGSVIEGKIKNITEFGIFIGLSDEIDGMIHLSDISWEKSGEEAVKDYTKGQTIEAKIIDVDVEKERISLGIKQLSENNIAMTQSLKKGDIVEAVVTGADKRRSGNGNSSHYKKADLSKENNDPMSYKEGDVLEAKLTSIWPKTLVLAFYVKAYEIKEKKALEEYSGANIPAMLWAKLWAQP